MLDYSILDMRTFFTPEDAAKAWCEITELTKENQHNCRHIYQEIREAIRTGKLRAEIPVSHHSNWVTRESWVEHHPENAKIARDDLKNWAESLGAKPKFLFPEMRPKPELEEAATPVKQKTVKPKAKKQNELHALLERVYLALRYEFAREPDADEVLLALKDRRKEFDTDEILLDVINKKISWVRTDDTPGIGMGRKAVQNRVSEFKEKYKKQPFVKKIPA